MFWRKKDKEAPRSERPSVENEKDFIEWLLRYGDDFKVYRDTTRRNTNKFVAFHSEIIMGELESLADEQSLSARIVACCDEYNEKLREQVDGAGGMELLPNYINDKASLLLVKLRLMMYILRDKYNGEITAPMVDVSGPFAEA